MTAQLTPKPAEIEQAPQRMAHVDAGSDQEHDEVPVDLNGHAPAGHFLHGPPPLSRSLPE